MESIVKLKTGRLMSLSEQEVLDCTRNGMSCDGGTMEGAFSFVMRNRGLTTENNYPYTRNQGYCNSRKKSASVATIRFESINLSSSKILISPCLLIIYFCIHLLLLFFFTLWQKTLGAMKRCRGMRKHC